MATQRKRKSRKSTARKKNSTLKSTLQRYWRKGTRLFRRWIIPVLLVALAYLTYPHIQQYFQKEQVPVGEYQGIDISKHQGNIDWEQVAHDRNIQFVYIKATEGASVVDSRYEQNIREARAAGLRVGSYHYFRGYKTAKEQFALFRRYVKKEQQDLLPMVDVEEVGNRQVSQQRLQDNLSEFMELIKEEYGSYPLLYSQYRFYNEKLAPTFNKYYIFIARYGRQEPVLKGNGKYNIWQYSEKGRIEGIKGYVDLDRFANGTTLETISIR